MVTSPQKGPSIGRDDDQVNREKSTAGKAALHNAVNGKFAAKTAYSGMLAPLSPRHLAAALTAPAPFTFPLATNHA
jgi:hypothetical protein